MKTIEIISGAQKTQFTTKSVTLNGREYFYINMSGVRNDQLNRVYTFVYDNEVKAVPYEEKDAKTLAVIFGQVRAMEEKRKAHDAAAAHHEKHAAPGAGTAPQTFTPSADAPAQNAAAQPQPPAGSFTPQQVPVENFAQPQYAAPDMYPDAQTPAAEQEPFTEEADPKAAKKAEKERLKAEKKTEKERLRAEKKAAKERAKAEKAAQKAGNMSPAENIPQADEIAETPVEVSGNAATEQSADAQDAIVFTGSVRSTEIHPSDDADADTASEPDPADAEKKKKLKKSIITFGIIVAAIAVIAVIFFLIFGTSKNPSPVNPSSTDSKTYQDVDELINDLQNN